MKSLRWLTGLAKLWLEFWLPLFLITLGVWYGTQWLNGNVLSQTYTIKAELDSKQVQQTKVTLAFTVLAIDAEIDRRNKNTEVTVKTAGSSLIELEFEYPVIEFVEVEKAIAQELNLPLDKIRKLIRYRLD
ncbi:hypothetical protein IQ264_21180 [Phormidium sp. LEGE 05292]|uniref:hypothetical protein n=1 Tax=[Phormidium] sp. LEGE 05292 TaxID=767427 RepID=UPI00187EF7BB|nr:hypothetical protein [Phormidium sp. LEGE 05292]MBE9227939.1 hypothetical protein [Phormidium sp. LEGE 05292]